MEKLPRARYPQEFKLQAVGMAIDEGLGVAETARRLGVSVKTLANRVKRYRQSGEVGACVPDQIAEVSRVRREVAQLRMERDNGDIFGQCPQAGDVRTPCSCGTDRALRHIASHYRRLASFYGFRLFMSRKGDCYDNAPMESFRAILKTERDITKNIALAPKP